MKSKYYGQAKLIKIIAIFALSCTVTLFTLLAIESSLSTDESKRVSQFFTDVLNSVINVSDEIDTKVETQSIKIVSDRLRYYITETPTVNVEFTPENATNKDVTFEIDKEEVATIDESGRISFKKMGDIYVTVRLKSNPKVSYVRGFSCVGEDPYALETKPTLKLLGRSDTTIKVGDMVSFSFNEGKTTTWLLDVTLGDEEIVNATSYRVYGIKSGVTVLDVKVKDSIDKQLTYTMPITVVDDGYVPIDKLEFNNDLVLVDGERCDDYRSLFKIENGYKSKDYECVLTSSDTEVLKVNTYSLVAEKPGTATLTFRSIYNPQLVVEKIVTVNYVQPERLTITGPDAIEPHKGMLYSASHYPTRYGNDVVWSVVSGKGHFDDANRLFIDGFSDVTIRCQSTIDESLYVEKTVKSSLFTSAYYLVRKLFGHVGLHALLGFGVTMSLLLLTRKKRFTALSPIICFAMSAFTEFIQLFAPGRGAYWTDIVIDTIGGFIGIAVSVVVTALVFLIWRVISKRGFVKLIKTIKTINLKNVFKKTETLSEIVENA